MKKDLALIYLGNKILLKKSTQEIPSVNDLEEYQLKKSKYLGEYEGNNYFVNSYLEEHFDEKRFELINMNIFKWNFTTSKSKIIAAGEQLNRWYKRHIYCGACGTTLKEKENERVLHCESCHNVYYPENSPAIIVLIKNKEKILLARNAAFPEKRYSLIAGYIDMGETAEEAVKRETIEEAGIKVKNIEYYGSQPWPFSSSLMLGFYAECDGDDEIEVDGVEIIDAGWYGKDFDIDIPNRGAIAGQMIRDFFKI